MFSKQSVVTLDMEGVLTPEIWIEFAKKTGIEELRLTTRDIPDYDVLMQGRLKILARENLTLSAIQDVIASLGLLEGAKDFLDKLRRDTQVIILSDTFQEFAYPLIEKMDFPTLFCHNLVVENDKIVSYKIRKAGHKKLTVTHLRALNFNVFAAGDSYNDTGMLLEANKGILFRAPKTVQTEFPELETAETYDDLYRLFQAFQESIE